MTFEDVLAVKSVSDVQVSPDGKWIAYVVTSADMKEDANDLAWNGLLQWRR